MSAYIPAPSAYWLPKLAPRQLAVFNSRARALLVPGPRLSGKTRAVLHRICRHLWETPGARIGMFARTMKSSKDGGAWTLLTKPQTGILAEWIAAGFGMRYTTETNGVPGPKTDGITRTPYFRVRNAAGGESEMLLFSLDNDDDAEAKLKELEFSMIYFSELDKFGDRRVLTVGLPSLRMGHLKYEDQMWIADCNPSEEGENSWIYKIWYMERNMTYEQYTAYQKKNDLPPLQEADFREFYSQVELIEILPKDNPFIDPRQLQEVRVSCGSDLGLYARHVEGKWIWGGGDSSRHFRGIFKPHIHVIGKEMPSEEDNTYLNPFPDSWELVTGWDLGDTNHAAVLLDRRMLGNKLHFSVVNELVSLHEEVSTEEFTETFLDQLKDLEEAMGKKYETERNWSDNSSLNKYNAAADTYPYLVVQAASGGRFVLREAMKGKGSVRVRVKLLKTLLKENRIRVSVHCKATIQMLKDLKKGKDELNYVVKDDNKHVFDALTYALLMECLDELEDVDEFTEGKRQTGLSVHVG